jgi:hypothetical protein
MLWGHLTDAFAAFSSAFIVLDALDDLDGIINLINGLSEIKVKIFCTGRTTLVNLGERLYTEPIRIEAHTEDVEVYLRDKLAKQKRFSSTHTERIVKNLLNEPRGT